MGRLTENQNQRERLSLSPGRNGKLYSKHKVQHMIKYSTSVGSFSSDLVLSDRYTTDIQPLEATNLELIWDACENTSYIMTR